MPSSRWYFIDVSLFIKLSVWLHCLPLCSSSCYKTNLCIFPIRMQLSTTGIFFKNMVERKPKDRLVIQLTFGLMELLGVFLLKENLQRKWTRHLGVLFRLLLLYLFQPKSGRDACKIFCLRRQNNLCGLQYSVSLLGSGDTCSCTSSKQISLVSPNRNHIFAPK